VKKNEGDSAMVVGDRRPALIEVGNFGGDNASLGCPENVGIRSLI